ncbi:MAG: heavy metal sensor histidine kinase [Terriglobia bacterium]|nr:heavy metal sensor histidine kinase [Terriglobia bacterium]
MKTLLGKTLRGRLTILYGVLLAAALAMYAAGSALYFLHDLTKQLDASLDRDVETVEGILSFSSDGRILLSTHEGEAGGDESNRGYLLEVWSPEGQLLYRSAQLAGLSLGPLRQFQQGHGRQKPQSYRLSDGERVRLTSRLHHMQGREVVVRLAVSEEPLWDEFWDMVSVLGLGLPVIVMIIGITGYVVAGRAIKPVNDMAQRASIISAEHLSERLQTPNPDDELGRLGAAFNQTLARLESSFEQLRRFTADASHELRTPLTAIRSVGEVALQSPGNAAIYRDAIGSMLEEVDRLTRLVESLLTISRADAGHIQLQKSSIDLLDLAQESAALLDVLAEEKNQTIAVTGDAAVTVSADRLILRQALINLIDNAVKYSPPGGRIRVHVHVTDGNAVVEVLDSGPGIPSEHAEKVFERFYRIDKARSRAEGGAGLGLSIVQWAVSAHGGTVELKQDTESGCAFVIHLPLEPSDRRLQKKEG